MSCADSYITTQTHPQNHGYYSADCYQAPYMGPYSSTSSPSYVHPASTSQQWGQTSTPNYHHQPPAHTYKWMHVKRTATKHTGMHCLPEISQILIMKFGKKHFFSVFKSLNVEFFEKTIFFEKTFFVI